MTYIEVIGRFAPTPEELTYDGIQRGLRRASGVGHTCEVRNPEWHWDIMRSASINSDILTATPKIRLKWHQDGHGRQMSIIVWSNVLPTRIKVLTPDEEHRIGERIWLKPFDIVRINNQACQHALPYVPPTVRRWFARYYF